MRASPGGKASPAAGCPRASAGLLCPEGAFGHPFGHGGRMVLPRKSFIDWYLRRGQTIRPIGQTPWDAGRSAFREGGLEIRPTKHTARQGQRGPGSASEEGLGQGVIDQALGGEETRLVPLAGGRERAVVPRRRTDAPLLLPQPAALASSQTVWPATKPRVVPPRSAMRKSMPCSAEVSTAAACQRAMTSARRGCAWVTGTPDTPPGVGFSRRRRRVIPRSWLAPRGSRGQARRRGLRNDATSWVSRPARWELAASSRGS